MNHRMPARAAATLALVLGLLVPVAHAADIRVLGSVAVKETFLDLVPEFERAGTDKVVPTWTGTADILKRLRAGEVYDLVLIGTDSLEALSREGKLIAASRVDFVRSGVGIAVRAGAARPDVGSADAVRRALLAAKSIGFSSGPSGVHLEAVFQRMGITDQVKPKLRQPPSGAPVGGMVARGEVEIGFQQVSELIHFPGIDYLGPLPPEIQQTTVFAGGIHTAAAAPEAARALARFLAAPASAATIRKHGMEPG